MQHINSSGIDVKMLDNALNETIRGAHPPGQISPFNKKAPTGGSGSKCEHPMMPTMEKESGPIDGGLQSKNYTGFTSSRKPPKHHRSLSRSE